jgi:ketosteroid isomerase-like protein
MRLVLVLCLLTAAPGVSLAEDVRGAVEKAYPAWDAVFNKQDAKAVAATYVPSAELMPPTHQVASGPRRSRSSGPSSSRTA